MDLSSTESWVSKQNQNNLSTNNIKIHLILPLHSHLQLFHSFETRALDTTPNCKVTDHFHRRIHHLSPLPAASWKVTTHSQCKTASTEQLPMLRACMTNSSVHTFNGSKRSSRKACQALITKRQHLTGRHSSARSSSPTKAMGLACIRTAGWLKWHSWSWEG